MKTLPTAERSTHMRTLSTVDI